MLIRRGKGRRVLKFSGHEIKDADITHVSLVKRGANRIPFAIVKNHEASGSRTLLIKGDRIEAGTRILADGSIVDATIVKDASGKFLGWLDGNGDIDTRDLSPQSLKKGSYQEPATPGEEANDSEAKAARRAEVEANRANEAKLSALHREAHILLGEPYSAEQQARLKIVSREIAVLEGQLIDAGVVKGEDAFTLLEKGIATNFVRRGGQSMNVDATGLPSTLSKADQQFADDLMSDLLGVRRRATAPIQKSDDEGDFGFADAIGVRRQR